MARWGVGSPGRANPNPADPVDPESVEGKLAATLSADGVGYTCLMAGGEVATPPAPVPRRDPMSQRICSRAGRVVDAVGGNLVTAFPSAIEVVRCSVEIQKRLAKRNPELPEGDRAAWRVRCNRKRMQLLLQAASYLGGSES